MKKVIIMCLIQILCLNSYAFADNLEPKVEAKGAILMDAKTGRVLWENNSDKPLAMASTTKIMTAIIALENGNLEDIVKVSKKSVLSPKVKMYLKEGEELRLYDLLLALMLQSYNDSAVAIAEHIGGSVEKFCEMMTEKAIELGCQDTIFETPSGLDSGEHHSTAYDMALITKYALQNEEFMKIINTSSASFSSNKRSYSFVNKNRFLNEFNGANGVKTGFTGKAGYCFIGSAKQDDMQLIAVALGSGWGSHGKEQKWVDTKNMLKYGFDNYKYYEVIKKGNSDKSVNILNGKEKIVNLSFENDLILALKEEELDKIKILYEYPEQMEAPIILGQNLGTATIFIDNEEIEKINLIADKEVYRNDINISFRKIIENWLHNLEK